MSPQPPLTFGTLLRRYRLAAGLTQAESAERAHLSLAAINTLERGARRAPRKDTVALLAEALALTADERAELEAAARQHRLALPLPPAPRPPSAARRTSPEAPPLPEAGPPHPVASHTVGLLVRAAPLSPPRTRRRLVAGLVSGLLVVALLGISLLFTGESGQLAWAGGGTLCLATDFPTSGKSPWAKHGKLAEQAVTLAVHQNPVLGSGYTLEAVTYDDVSPMTGHVDAPTGAHNVQQMVRNPCIVGMIGPYNSPVAQAEMPIAANAGLVMISPSNTDPALTVRYYADLEGVAFDQLHPAGKPLAYFRAASTDVAQVIVDADFTFQDLGARSVYVVSDPYAYGIALANFFSERFQVEGGTIAGHQSILPENPSRIAQVAARIVATSPDAVFYGGLTQNGGGLLKRQLVSLGYRGPLVGGDGIARDPDFIAQAGADAANGTFATVAAPDPSSFTSGAAARFVRDYQAQYPGQAPDGYSANANDAAMIVITAIKHLIGAGKAVTRQAVRDQVQNIQYIGVTGQISFDRNGDTTHRVFSVYTVQDGQWVWFKQVSV